MRIDISNYEIYAIDYLDGKLSPQEVAEFMAFLAEFPEIEFEMQNIPYSTVLCDPKTFPNKHGLKKNINTDVILNSINLEEFVIAYYEGDLTKQVSYELESYVNNHPEAKRIFKIYGQTKITPDTTIVFNNKKSLKKKIVSLNKRYAWYGMGAAASILLLAGLFLFKSTYLTRSSREQYLSTPPLKEAFESTERLTQQEAYRLDKIELALDQRFTTAVKVNSPSENDSVKQFEKKAESESIEPITIELSISEKPIENLLPAFSVEHPVETSSRADLTQKNKRDKKSLKFIAVLQVSIKGMNKLTEGSLILDTERDDQGKLKSLALNTETFRIKKSFRNDGPVTN